MTPRVLRALCWSAIETGPSEIRRCLARSDRERSALARPGSAGLWPYHPAIDLALVGQQLVGAEPDRDLRGRALGAVRRVHQVLPHLHGEVSPDRARGRVAGTRGAVHRPNVGDGVGTLEDHRDQRPGRDEGDEPLEERLALVDRIVAFGQLAIDVDQLEPDDLEAALFVAGDDPAGQQTLDAVGLHEDEGTLGHCTTPLRTIDARASVAGRRRGAGEPAAGSGPGSVPANGRGFLDGWRCRGLGLGRRGGGFRRNRRCRGLGLG